jgi:hypothetical protein
MKQYIYNIFHAISCLISALTGGSPKESTSQRTAKAANAHYLSPTFKGMWFEIQERLIDGFFYYVFGEENHCQNSLVGETNTKEIWDWTK